ncbi:MAG TPA: hypothetical protein VLW50_05470 [Streptosporangiaceae bacterium]|nr:hypothetical protein [Streptosporangiaceae bacterium]
MKASTQPAQSVVVCGRIAPAEADPGALDAPPGSPDRVERTVCGRVISVQPPSAYPGSSAPAV